MIGNLAILLGLELRVHAKPAWIDLFPNSKVSHLSRLTSDHCPILLNANPSFSPGCKPFRFELFWMKHHTFRPLTANIWNVEVFNLTETIQRFKK